jgi:hypothetical protein
MSGKKFPVLMLAIGVMAPPAHAKIYHFTFESNDKVLSIADGTFITDDKTNLIVNVTGNLTSTNPALLGGHSKVSFTLAGPGTGADGNQLWTNVYDVANGTFLGAGLGLLMSTGDFSTIYDSARFTQCPARTCLSIAPTTNGPVWAPGDPGVLQIKAEMSKAARADSRP